MEKLKKYLNDYQDAEILDIATGAGSFIGILTHQYDGYSRIVGIDHQKKAIEAANKNFEDSRISFVEMDADDMSFDENSFDIVCLSNSLHHMSDINRTISNMIRILKPGGILLFNEMKSDNVSESQMTHTHFHHFWAEVNRENGIVHNETMTHKEILDIFYENNDLELVEAWDMDVPEPGEMPPEAYDFLRNTLDKSLKAIEGHPEYARFEKRSEELKDMLEKIGFASATQVVAIVRPK